MTLKENVYQAVHDYLKRRIDILSEEDELEDDYIKSSVIKGKLNELLKVQNLIYKMFADYNENLAQHPDVKPVRINTNEKITKPR